MWHLDEVFMASDGAKHYLWRGVDQSGNALDIPIQSRRKTQAAKRFSRKLLKKVRYAPRVVITDTLASGGAAEREVLPGVERRRHSRLNNRAEDAHQPTRGRERRMRRCTSSERARRFRPRRHRLPSPTVR